MFPSVAKEDVREKIKEKNWDDRFVKSTIPDYSPLRDKHTKSYRRSVGKDVVKETGKVEKGDGKRTYFEKRMKLMDELVVLHR